MKLLFLVPYPLGEAPSQRFRFEQYFDILESEGYELSVSSFLDLATWKILYEPGNSWKKLYGVLSGFVRRIKDLFEASRVDLVFIHREASPIGPPIFEWIITKLLGKKVIYDFDDAIWLPNTSKENKLAANLKWHQKVSSICAWSWKVSCGNQYLCDYANQYNQQVALNPTTIDTHKLHLPSEIDSEHSLTIGWTGTHSTVKYLKDLYPIIERLRVDYNFEFLIISNQDPRFKQFDYEFKQWNKETEITDLNRIDIGVMPLVDDQWSKGKCGFKALQFMALSIPAVASPVGVNDTIIDDGKSGFLAEKPKDWEETLRKLLSDQQLRLEIGKAGRQKVEKGYSVLSNTDNFLSLFRH